MELRKVDLGAGIALFGAPTVPVLRPRVVPRRADAPFEHLAKLGLRFGVALLGGGLEPARRGDVVTVHP